MTQEEITALAREYAEWICPYKDKSANLSILDIREAERLINFLLRRYCLVEKSKLQEEYKKVCESVNRHSATTGCLFFVGQKQTLESLFPDLGKEVKE